MSAVRTTAEKAKLARIAAGRAVIYASVLVLSGLFFIDLAPTREADPDDRMAYYFALLVGSFLFEKITMFDAEVAATFTERVDGTFLVRVELEGISGGPTAPVPKGPPRW